MNMQAECSTTSRLKWAVVDCVRPIEGWHLVRVVVALVLLTAAATKCHQCCTGPIPGAGIFSAKWFVICLVEAEWLGSLVLLACLLPKPSWAAALMCFGAFALLSLGKGLMGEASCGCFGRWEVNPFLTATLDLVIVVSLLRWRPKQLDINLRQLLARATFVLAVWATVGVPAAYAMGGYTPASLSQAGKIIGDGKVVVLKPDTWIGKQLPLLDYIDIGDKLKRGEWVVVLYHHDCPRCQEAMPQYEETARQPASGRRLALIEVPPYGEMDAVPLSSNIQWSLGRLSNDNRWFVRTPVEIVLKAGTVIVRPSEGNDDRIHY